MTNSEQVRQWAHLMVQWPSKAARANLAVAADDSHSNLGWDGATSTLHSRPLDAGGHIELGFNFATSHLVWRVDRHETGSFDVFANTSGQIESWVDNLLAQAKLDPATAAAVPYDLDGTTAPQDSPAVRAAIAELGSVYGWASQLLGATVSQHGPTAAKPPEVRCWPHHFDIAALFTLEEADAETARSIGMGVSPGDASYASPYLYISPWPRPDTASLPAAPAPFTWHTEGFVSLVCLVNDIRPLSDQAERCAIAFKLVKSLATG